MSGLSWRERLRRMNQRSLFHRDPPIPEGAAGAEGAAAEVLAGDTTHSEAMQRLQVGMVGIVAMVLLVGLASVIGGQAERNDRLAAPEAAPTTQPGAAAAQANPLADAGVVPDIAAEPEPTPSPSPGSNPGDLSRPGASAPGPSLPGNAAPQ
ncbi:MAG: hypothetical protein ACKO1N_04680 [Erythrobacter sp.]